MVVYATASAAAEAADVISVDTAISQPSPPPLYAAGR